MRSGHYTVGVDIPAGTYKFTAVKGGGNVFAPGLNEIMGEPSKNDSLDMYTEKVEDILLQNGDVLTLSSVRLGISSRDASADELQTREQEITDTITLHPNLSYVSGTDFEPGTYCVEVVSGGGNVYTENSDRLGMNTIMGTDDQNTAGLPDFMNSNSITFPSLTVPFCTLGM